MAKKTYEKPLAIDAPFDETLERFASTDPAEIPSRVNSEDVTPLVLHEDAETGDRFVLYHRQDGLKFELLFEDEEPYATQRQMADLFGVTQQNIAYHVGQILKSGELDGEGSVHKEILYTAADGKQYRTQAYNLDMVLSVGHKVNSREGVMFRRWSRQTERQYLLKGFVIDKGRLKGQPDRFAELRDIIRDIRSDEANVYAELRRMCSLCTDYDPKSDAAHVFYSHMQAKLYWAVVSHTPSEILVTRINADSPNLGLQTWEKAKVLQEDVVNAKNALTASELKEFNRVHDILLSVFEDQLDVGRLTTMKDAERLLDEQLAQLGRPVLKHGGSVSSTQAKAHAKAQYKLYNDRRKAAEKARVDAELAELKKVVKAKKPGKKG